MCVSVYCFLERKLIIFIPGTGRSRKRRDNGHARWPARDRGAKCFRIMELMTLEIEDEGLKHHFPRSRMVEILPFTCGQADVQPALLMTLAD